MSRAVAHVVALALFACTLLAARAGRGQPEPPKPWAVGVSEEQQAAAFALFAEGNARFAERRFGEAVAKYREALVHWDHPAIRYNIVLCLIDLGQPLEAWEHLELALRHGPAPLSPGGDEKYQAGLNYQKLLAAQIGTLRVSCEEPGAQVILDGTTLFTAPGEASRRVTPGSHLIVATKAGFLTATVPVLVPPGQELHQRVELAPLSSATRLERRWRPWKPWAVVGAGVALAGVGLLFELQAGADYEDYDRTFADRCTPSCPAGDPRVTEIEGILSRARLEHIAGVSLMSVGIAGVTAGLVGVYLNRPRPVVDKPPLTLAPVVGASEASLLVRWTW